MTRVIASIEARMGSSRLPGKVLADICGKPALTRLTDRLRVCGTLDDIVLATSIDPRDDVLEAWANEEGIHCFRGSEDDVLGRVVGAHQSMKSDIIVEITGDCPLTDPEVIDIGVETFFANPCDVVHNIRPPSYPQGIDLQVFRYTDLAEVADTIDDPAVREHVSLHFYENPDRYRLLALAAPRSWHGPDLRFQLDYPEDLTLIRTIYERLEPNHGGNFGVGEILDLLRQNPKLAEINRHCEEKPVR